MDTLDGILASYSDFEYRMMEKFAEKQEPLFVPTEDECDEIFLT